MAYTAPTALQAQNVARILGFSDKAILTANAKAATALETMNCARFLGTSQKGYDAALGKAGPTGAGYVWT